MFSRLWSNLSCLLTCFPSISSRSRFWTEAKKSKESSWRLSLPLVLGLFKQLLPHLFSCREWQKVKGLKGPSHQCIKWHWISLNLYIGVYIYNVYILYIYIWYIYICYHLGQWNAWQWMKNMIPKIWPGTATEVELQIGLKDYDTQRDKRFAGAGGADLWTGSTSAV